MLDAPRMTKIAIINGPNLNLLGQREPGIYGQQSFDDYYQNLCKFFPDVSFTYFQSNVEGELVNALQEAAQSAQGIVLNPAAYTHTSVAIGDTVAAITVPVIEVHISNVQAREEFRKLSYVSAKAVGTITGLGLQGYELAVRWFLGQKKN
jgi:3-dehydroquinate dehydratase-2